MTFRLPTLASAEIRLAALTAASRFCLSAPPSRLSSPPAVTFQMTSLDLLVRMASSPASPPQSSDKSASVRLVASPSPSARALDVSAVRGKKYGVG